METEVFNRNNSAGNESAGGNSAKRVAVGAAAATVGAVGGAAAVYAATHDTVDEKPGLAEPAVIVPNPEVVNPEEVQEPTEEEKTFAAAQPTVTHVTNNHYHNHFESVEPEPEVVHIVHHNEPVPQFSGTPETVVNIHEDIVNHIHVQEPSFANPVDVIANDILAQGEFVDPMTVRAQNLDIASVDAVETIDGHHLTTASFASPEGGDMYLVDIPDPMAAPDVIYPSSSSVADVDTARFLAQGVADIVADHVGGEAGDIIHEVNGLIDLV